MSPRDYERARLERWGEREEFPGESLLSSLIVARNLKVRD